MGREDWYRRTTWTLEDQKSFHARLNRSRDYNKAHYTLCQAGYLGGTGKPKMVVAALELIELALDRWAKPTDLAVAYCLRAECYKSLGDQDQVVENYRKALETEKEYPQSLTRAGTDYPWFIAKNELTDLYDEALTVIDSPARPSMLREDQFLRYAARAFILNEQGHLEEASSSANEAITAALSRDSGFSRHKELGLVGSKHSKLVKRLRKLAAFQRKSFLSKTSQKWKLHTSLAVMLVALVPMYYSHQLPVGAGSTAIAISWGSILLATIGFFFPIFSVRCPSCKHRIYWQALNENTPLGWFDWIESLRACPNCRYEPET